MKPLWLFLLVLPMAAQTQTGIAQAGMSDWTAENCSNYHSTWVHISKTEGLEGIGPEFLANNAAFLSSGCTIRGAVCPRSEQEKRLADTLTLMAVADGTASFFLPFRCTAQ